MNISDWVGKSYDDDLGIFRIKKCREVEGGWVIMALSGRLVSCNFIDEVNYKDWLIKVNNVKEG